MLAIALATRPHAAASCLSAGRSSPPKVGSMSPANQPLCALRCRARRAGIQVSLFIDPEPRQIEASRKVRAPTPSSSIPAPIATALADGDRPDAERELQALDRGAEAAARPPGSKSMPATASTMTMSAPSPRFPRSSSSISVTTSWARPLFVGLAESVARMRALMDGAREALRHSATEAKVGGT